jgi:hypothetical protein
MELEQTFKFDQAEARERAHALADYLANKHGMQVSWVDDDRAHVKGKYMVVAIDVEVSVEPGKVRVKGKDPGMLWRAPAKKYVSSKLETYFNPATSSADLPRR